MTYLTAEGKHTIYSSEESYAQAFIREVNNDLNDVKRSFFKIGFRLAEASKLKYYEELGYESIIELAEDKFGFKKSTTYGLMQVYHHCRSRDKNDSALTMDKAYADYNFSQLQEISRLRWGGGERLIRPSDNVTKIKHFVSVWNKDGESSDARGCETIDDYLRKTGRLAEVETAALPTPNLLELSEEQEKPEEEIFQKSGKLEAEQQTREEINNSRNLEKSEVHNEPTTTPMTDDELIKQSIKYGTGAEDFKFKIVEYYTQPTPPLQTEFIKYVMEAYGVGDCGLLEFDCKKLTIHRQSGGKIVMPWAVVAGHIARLIIADEYLDEDEKERYVQWKAEKDSVTDASEPSEEPEEPDTKLEVYENVTGRIETPDDELVEYCLTADCHVAALGIKFEIYDRYFLMEPNPFFQEFLINTYSNFSVPDKWGEGGHFDRLESDKQRGLIIYRIGGGQLLLNWDTVTGKIMNLIKADKYLTDEEQKQFNEERARKTANEKARRKQTNREYLATLPDEELINKLLVKILNVYPFRGESSKFLSMTRSKLIEWFNEPHVVQE